MNISWLLNRAGRMSIPELYWRGYESFRKLRDRLSFKHRKVSAKASDLLDILPPLSQAWEIRFFEHSISWKNEPIPWQNPAIPPRPPVQHWSLINYRDVQKHGDPKQTWELNRHQFLRNWVHNESISLDDRANAVSRLLLNWIEANPYGLGINWCSSLEVALRLLSWENAIEYIGESHFPPRALRLIHRSVEEHARHLRRYPSLYSSANNHRIGELLGELAAAAITPGYPRLLTAAWQAWQQLERESEIQVSTDGVSREQASYYHIYVLLYFRRAAVYADQLGFPKRLEFRQCIENMQQFLDCITGSDGQWFEIGDRDDGNFLALQPWSNAEPLVIAHSVPYGCYVFQDGGYAVWKSQREHILFRAGQFGYPSIAAHSHCDQLSVLLKIDGYDILTDSGTGSYHDLRVWRRYFRGTSAHNTIVINSMEQAQYGGPFLWKTSPNADFLEISANECQAKLAVSGRPTHFRKLEVCTEPLYFLKVIDTIIPSASSRPHADCILIWNFGKNVQLKQVTPKKQSQDHKFQISIKSIKLMLEIATNAPSTAHIYYGDEQVPAGFYSRQFGEREPIYQLRIAVKSEQVHFSSLFSYEDGSQCAE